MEEWNKQIFFSCVKCEYKGISILSGDSSIIKPSVKEKEAESKCLVYC